LLRRWSKHVTVTERFIDEAIRKVAIEEFLSNELERAGFGGVDVTRTPLGTRITLRVMKPGLVIGRRGESIRNLTKTIEEKFGLPNPQIAVVEIEAPELNPCIMASRIASALQRGTHFRSVGFWTVNQIMKAGALGVEIVIRGKLRTQRHRYEKFKAGYLPKAGDPAAKNTRTAVAHVKLKPGITGIKVSIIPPGVRFPDQAEIKPVAEEINVKGSEALTEEEEASSKVEEEI